VDQKSLIKFIKKLPKVELHLHLEGAIRPKTAMALMRRNKRSFVPESEHDVKRYYRFSNLSEFVLSMRSVTDNIATLADLQQITKELLINLTEQNVRYVEFDCALQKYINLGFSLKDIVDTIYETVLAYQQEHDIKAGLVANLLRAHGPTLAIELVEKILVLDHPFIVGVGLSGDETKYPQQLFIKAFKMVNSSRLHSTVHAGEAKGADSVWSALFDLGAKRIDHGTRSIEDPHLVDYLVKHRIPLTQCITSNVRLRVVDGRHVHPFGEFYKKGVKVTLNTDDPQVFETSLNNEYIIAAKDFSLDASDLYTIVRNGIEASFADDETKSLLTSTLVSQVKTSLEESGSVIFSDAQINNPTVQR
jgi:adenosine deaminase